MQKINLQNNKGFTIIETMIAISLFLIIVTIGMGSLLNANLLHQKSQDMRSIMDSLSFIMEDMSRNLRTGYDYHCSDNLSDLSIPLSCENGGGVIAFESSDGDPEEASDQWVYKIASLDSGETYNISRSVSGGASESFVQLNPEEVKIDSASSFTVTGAEPGDSEQPFVTIKLIGIISSRGVDTPFSLQTSVSQRLLDIEPQTPELPLAPEGPPVE